MLNTAARGASGGGTGDAGGGNTRGIGGGSSGGGTIDHLAIAHCEHHIGPVARIDQVVNQIGRRAPRRARNVQHAQVSTGTQAGKVAELPGEDEETVNLSRKLLASGDFTQASALAFLVFILLYFPCIATIAAIGAEAGWKWAAAAVAYNTVLAWVVAWAVYRLFMWL